MSNMDKDLYNMDEINALMEDLFAADSTAVDMVEAVSNELTKMGGNLEQFSEEETTRFKIFQEWLENDKIGRAPVTPYQSNFGGVEKDNLNQLNNQTVTGRDKVIFEKDEQNSSLAGVKNVTGIEDIQDFFSVGKDFDQLKGGDMPKLMDIDQQIGEIQKLSEADKREIDQEFVESMGMDLNRLRQVSGATSAWNEIASIKLELEELSSHARKLSHRFNEFINIYVQQHIPK